MTLYACILSIYYRRTVGLRGLDDGRSRAHYCRRGKPRAVVHSATAVGLPETRDFGSYSQIL